MDIHDFITSDEIDDLPDDPHQAFSEFVRLARKRLFERTRELDDEHGYSLLEEARLGFMNVVVAAAKGFGIEPFASMEVPRINQFGYQEHQQFKTDLDHYLTQIMLGTGRYRSSVRLSAAEKEKIRTYVNALKDCISSSTLPDKKKNRLQAKLGEFEEELEKKRVNLLAASVVALAFLGAPDDVWGSYEIVSKLTTNLLGVVGDAKEREEEEPQLPSSDDPVALSPPRKEPDTKKLAVDDLDDEIPF